MARTGGQVWLCLLLGAALLSEGYCKAALRGGSYRARRQVEEEPEEDLAAVFTRFLSSDPETQQDYLRYGLELAEYHLLESYDGIKDHTDAQDRIFLDSVQSVIDAVQSIDNDPARTPAALAELATNPDNLLLFTSLVVTTVFVAQLSSFALFGTSLSAPLTFEEDGEAGADPGGITGMLMTLMNILPNLFADFVNAARDVTTPNDEASDEEDGSGSGSGDDKDEGSGEQDGEEVESPGIFELLMNMITSIFPGSDPNENKQSDLEAEGSGIEEDEDEDNDIHIGVDVEPGSFLDMIINLIPNPGSAEDTTEIPGEEMTTADPGDLGTSFGGVSVSLAPIDLANIFVQVQEIVGVSCNCTDDSLTEEMITNTTMRLLGETLEQHNKMRHYSGLKKDTNAQKKGRRAEEKKPKKGGRRKKWSQRMPKSL